MNPALNTFGFSRPNNTPNIAIDFVESDEAVDRYSTLPGVITFLINWNNNTMVVKERDSIGMLKPYRYFNLSEFFPQTTIQPPVESQNSVQNGNDFQSQIDELKSMIAQLTLQKNDKQNFNNNKKGG